MIAQGVERVSFESGRPWRWWLWVDEPMPRFPGRRLDAQPDGRFMFARGGRATTEEDAQRQLLVAQNDAAFEAREFRFRPTHRLTAAGIVPLEPAPRGIEA